MTTATASRHGKRSLALGAAAGIVAASAFGAAPGWAFTDPGGSSENQPAATSSPGPASTAAGDSAAGPIGNHSLPQADLDAAILRDLGLTPEQFAAAGELGSRAAAAAEQLRTIPGYAGIRLQDNKISVTGGGAELESAVGKLAATVPGISLEEPAVPAPNPTPPATEPAGTPASPPPSSAPQQTPSAEPAAPAPGPQVAASTEQLFQAYVREVGTAGLQAVVTSGGSFVIRTGGVASAQSIQDGAPGTASNQPGTPSTDAVPGKISPAEFVSKYANVVLDGAAPLKPETDVPGGVGYLSDTGFTCSTGFSAFDPAGLPTVLTAGHCAEDGTAKTADLLLGGAPAGRLGSFQFSQFGGPGNSPVLDPNTPTGSDYTAVADPGNVGTDIAVIGTIPQGLDPLPATSTHGDPSQPGPDVKIIGTASPVPGMPVCRSGWRTGWSCGHISAVGIFLVGGPNYPANANDIRAFNGFLSYDVQSSGGDSGGPWISGNFAVGTHSAGDSDGVLNIAVAATLEDSLKVLPGYQLELFLNKPGLVTTADSTVKAGTSITGQVPAAPASAVAAGSKVRITFAGRPPFDVPLDAAGNWSFTAPEAPGPFTFTAETVNGFSGSGPATVSLLIAPSFLPAPVITTPASQPLTSLDAVEGTGTPRATVTLSGDVAGSALVGDDGRWLIPLQAPAPYGKVNVTAVQSYPGLPDSPAATAAFAVMPPPPAVSSLSDGQHLQHDALPGAIAGTGLTGADVTVSLDGKPLSSAPAGAAQGSRSMGLVLAPLVLVDGGTWQVPFPAAPAAGTHVLAVTQAVDGVASAPAQLSFIIDAAPSVLPAGNITDGTLAATGAGGLVTAAIAAAAALAVGVLLMVLVRRRSRRSAG
ncbi:S1 family peptidase [Arthrobacter sp. SLBN-122]|uniref:S1 family peptidase n=1 Tax=Arthrobacter sp. SLBN-122 TaxID=2768455 RepID=UPI00116CE015|nr:S1 family peptidase [Arthrobacter sp. SLBN-122]TQJ33754.1 hypothetical protein FBY36_0976 [Arthrobacter sp. SLBN-122]